MRSRPPSPLEIDAWRSALASIEPLSDEELAPVRDGLVAIELAVGEHYLSVGESPSRAALVCRGVLREAIVFEDGAERTRSFNVEGDFAGSLSDLLVARPSRTQVVADEASTLLSVSWASVQRAARASVSWRALLHRVTERLYLAKADREYELLGLDAEQRYQCFRRRYGALEPRFSQRAVASYLGITPEHLSRIRSRLRAR